MIKNRDFANKKKGLAPGETEKVLNNLEESYLESNGKQFMIRADFGGKLNDASGLENKDSPARKKQSNINLPKI